MINIDDKIFMLWRNRKKLFVFIALFLIIGVISFSAFIKQTNKEAEEFRQRYKLIERCDSLSGIIYEILCRRGVSAVSMSGGDELRLSISRNYYYEIYSLCEFINIGDSLQKQMDCDTLHIFRENQKFYFVIGKEIGEYRNRRFYNLQGAR